jgi:O-antigen/teichoic acid export membrane protein
MIPFQKLIRSLKVETGFVYVTASTIISSSLGAAFFLYFATLVTVDRYGQINYLISSGAVAFAISALGMDATIMTFVPKRSIQVLYEANFIVLISGISAAVLLGTLLNNYLIGLLVLATTCYYMSSVELLTTKRYKENSILSVGGKVTQVTLSLLLYFAMGVNGFILGYIISYFLFGYRFIFSLKDVKFRLDHIRDLWRFSAKMYGSNLSNLAPNPTALMVGLDKILIGAIFGYYVLGSYQLSYQVFMFLAMVPVNLFRFLLPYEAGGVTKRTVKFVALVIACVLVVIVIFGSPYAIHLFFPKYTQSIQPIQIISLSIVPLTLVNIVGTKIVAEEKRAHHMFYAGLITIASETLLLWILGTYLGLVGLAVSLVMALTIEFFYLFFMNRGRVF